MAGCFCRALTADLTIRPIPISLRIGAAETARRQANTALTANPSPQLRLKIDDLLNRIGEEDKK